MGITLEVELLMPAMPSSFVVKSPRSGKLENAWDQMKVSVSELDESAVEKICQQWSAEFRQHAFRQRITHHTHDGPPKVSTALATVPSSYFGPDIGDDE
jgi:hypothetical protein